jgi:hypothetical protein
VVYLWKVLFHAQNSTNGHVNIDSNYEIKIIVYVNKLVLRDITMMHLQITVTSKSLRAIIVGECTLKPEF